MQENEIYRTEKTAESVVQAGRLQRNSRYSRKRTNTYPGRTQEQRSHQNVPENGRKM
jgi:hypothetical protein